MDKTIGNQFRMGNPRRRELVFQVLLHIILFVFFSFDKDSPRIEFYQFAFFANYVLAAFWINYVLLPSFYYKGQYWLFSIFVIVIVASVILIEELVLEKIYFPDSRGKGFPGVIFSLLEVLPIILILTGFKFAWDAHQKDKEVTSLQQAIRESELRYLKSQINPHFLFNNLNNLYSYSIENSPNVPGLILKLSSVLRYMLYDCKEDFVRLTKEIDHLQSFTELNELQIESRGQVTFIREPHLGNYIISPLILSVFVENAFKHSTASQNEDIKIDILIRVSTQGVLHFRCQNSFMPLKNTDGLSSGIGLENVRKRLALVYPQKHELEINDSNGIYTVELKIELTDYKTKS